MHMADALVSPTVGGIMWAVSAGLVGYCSTQAKKQLNDTTAPLMGVLGAFVFAAQMINFAIPATGSSGHLGGGLLLAILLGPWASFLTISSILTIQALFFADGGILALGCNIFNLGFFPCLIAYPFIYRPIAAGNPTRMRIFTATVIAAVVGLQLGALGVVLETTFSGITELPLLTFALFMQPIHLAIGFIEGLATASVVLFLYNARPELLRSANYKPPAMRNAPFPVLKTFALLALLTGGIVSWFASSHPDGLEWSIIKTSGAQEITARKNTLTDATTSLQGRSAIMPAYGFVKKTPQEKGSAASGAGLKDRRIGTTAAGLLGGGLCLLFMTVVGFLFRLCRAKA